MPTAVVPTRAALIVESNEIYRDHLHEMLSELGWAVDTAWNGTIGRERAFRHDYDLVLCSLALPQHDEAKTIACIRGQQPFARILVLPSAAALPDDSSLTAAYDRGADGMLAKPFGIYDLSKAIIAPPRSTATNEFQAIADVAQADAPVLEWAHDLRAAPQLLAGLKCRHVVADRGYDADALLELIRTAGAQPHIPSTSQRIDHRSVNRRIYWQRNLVERFFCKLKHFRRIATRFDKLARNLLAAVALVSARLWMQAYESTT